MGNVQWPPAPQTTTTEDKTIHTGAKTSVSTLREKFQGSTDGDTSMSAPIDTGARESVSTLRERFEDPGLPETPFAPLIPMAPPAPELDIAPTRGPSAPPPPPGPLGVGTAPKPLTRLAPKAKAISTPGFGKEFEGPSIGVESELGGFVCALPQNADRAFAFVRRVDTGEALVMITKDMSTGAYSNPAKRDFVKTEQNWKVHTLELVTYPAAMGNPEAITHRNLATRFLLSTFHTRLGSSNHEPLTTMLSPDGAYELVVTNRSHVLAAGNGVMLDAEPAVSMPSSGQQATMGVKAKELGTGASPELEMLEAAPWYDKSVKDEIKTQLSTATSAGDVERVYAYMKSILAFTSHLVDKYALPIGSYAPGKPQKAQGLTDPAVKNEWKILPRTRPTIIIDTLEGTDRQLVKKLLMAAAPVGDPTIWAAVRQYIMMEGGEVAGHGINDAKVGGETALLFEFRSVPEGLSPMVPTEEKKNTPTIDDPLGAVTSNKGAVIKGMKAFAGQHLDELKSWFDAQDSTKWGPKSGAQILLQAAANQLARWMIAAYPDEWAALTTPVTDDTFSYAM